MANPVQRLRYFDGEYLRSYDFTDEQSYHIAMRRLMNLKLHLHGIVYGLELVEDQDSVSGGPYFFSIAPGMAIDQSGREILVSAPYSLTNVLNAPGLSSGTYEVWICYQESETGLPAAGYLDCNVQNQNTRWQESFQVQLKPVNGPSIVTDCGGVRLGIVKLNLSGLGLQITYPVYNVERHYVGIRAQRLIAPDQIDASPDPFDITAMTPNYLPDQPLPGYLDVHPGVFNRGNVIVKKNLVVGDDFVLDPKKQKGLPGNFPPSGNLKVTNDLFLNGTFYGFNSTSGEWYGLQQYIQSLMPFDIRIESADIILPLNPPSINAFPNVTGTFSVPSPIPSSILGSPRKAIVTLAISEIGWRSANDLQPHWSGNTNGFILQVSPSYAQNNPTFPFNLSVDWTAGPAVTVGGNVLLPITSVSISYTVIFTP